VYERICEAAKVATPPLRQSGRYIAKAQTALSEAVLLHAMFYVGYFPPNTLPD